MTTPTTPLAPHYGWRQAEIEESAREIAAVGRQLGSATNAYNDAAESAASWVLPQLRRLETLDAKSEKALVTPAPIDQAVRAIVAKLPPETSA